ncbi:MAG: hypothetical protein ACR2PG_00600 [Hyphomicrobiaceae bacterium]
MTYRNTNYYLGVSLTACALLVAVAGAPTPVSARLDAQSSIPSQMPHTRGLDRELVGLGSETRKTSATVSSVRRDVRSTRKDVDRVRSLLKKVHKMERRLSRLVRQLSPFQSVPKVRTPVRLLIKNLQKLQSTFRSVRQKAGRVDKKALVPIRKKLIALERKLTSAQRKLGEVFVTTQSARATLARSAAAAANNASTRRGLESAAKQVRPAASQTRRATQQINGETNTVRRHQSSLRRGMAGLWKVESALASMDRKLRPAEKFAAKLSKVLKKRISIKIPPFKPVSFTIRQVLEGPRKVAGKLLRPLEKLADKALQPILKKAKLQIRPPKGLAQLPAKLNRLQSLGNSLMRSVDKLSSALGPGFSRQADRFTRLVKQRIR